MDGGGLASAGSSSASGRATKPKKRRFEFANGITVWATSEAMARLVAGMDVGMPPEATPEGAGASLVALEPVRADLAKPPARLVPAPPQGPTQAGIATETARFAERRRLAQLRAEEEAIILTLLDEAA